MSLVHPMWLATPAAACLALAAAALSPQPLGGQPAAPQVSPMSGAVSAALSAQARTRFAQLPLAFERNVGQTDAQVEFFARGPGYGLFLTPTEAVFRLQASQPSNEREHGAGDAQLASDVVRMRLTGARAADRIEGVRPQDGTSHYLMGNDPAQWRHSVPRFEQVRYAGVYDGVDLVYYGNQQQLEYDFVVAPGADPAQIGVQFQGPRALRLDAEGNLVLATALGDMVQHKPVAYQDIDGQRRPVAARYRLDGDRIAFAVGDYDRDHALVIDPVLGYATHLGGVGDDFASAIAVDSAGNAYVTGLTASADFPKTGPIQATMAGVTDVFVTKFNAAGRALVYSTYLGGTKGDVAYGIAVDSAGSAYVTGTTQSDNFPTKTPLQGTLGGLRNVFVSKLAPNGASLVYSTYFGTKSEVGTRIAVDGSGNAVVSGFGTGTITFPAGAYQGTFGGGVDADGILFKLSASGGQMLWGTYLGGAKADYVEDVKLDAAGNVYFAGHTQSTGLPVRNALQPNHAGNTDAFYGKFSSAGAPQFVSFFGGPGAEGANGVAVDGSGNLYIAGTAYGTGLPLRNPIQNSGGGWDGFVSKFNAAGSALVYSTYLGGVNTEELAALAVDGYGRAFVVGRTDSPDFPTASPWQPIFASGGADGFVTAINMSGNDFYWSSFAGGIRDDNLLGLVARADGTVYIAGRSFGAFPTTPSPYQVAGKGGRDAVVMRVGGVTPTSARHRLRDFNDDARADVFWRNATTGENLLWGSASDIVETPLTLRAAPWSVAAVGDFNGDHKADILWRNGTSGANEIWRSGRSSNRQAVSTQANVAWTVAGAGDFDGDQRFDIVWRNTTTGANELWRSAYLGQRQALTAVADQNWKIAGIGDFNADGRDDLFWRNSSTGANELWLSGLSTQKQVLATQATSWSVGGVGDINGDGKADIVWRDGTSGNNAAWLGGTVQQALTATTDLNWKIFGVADYNLADGKADILWRNTSNGQNVLWSSGSSTSIRTLAPMTDQNWAPVR